jgi:hypothetical protein
MRITRLTCLLVFLALVLGGATAQTVSGSSPSSSPEAKAKKSGKSKSKPKKTATLETAAPVAAAGPANLASDMPVDLQAIVDQIHVGRMPCELGQTVTLLHDAHQAGRFNLFIKNHIYSMQPVRSATGALRLEDPAKGAVWIQLADKSMLMNNQLGQRMADLCQSPAQMLVAEAQKLSPPPHLLESAPGAGLAQK